LDVIGEEEEEKAAAAAAKFILCVGGYDVM
jgi:hypothetical protein